MPEIRRTIWVDGVKASISGMDPTEATMRTDMRTLAERPLSVTLPQPRAGTRVKIVRPSRMPNIWNSVRVTAPTRRARSVVR